MWAKHISPAFHHILIRTRLGRHLTCEEGLKSECCRIFSAFNVGFYVPLPSPVVFRLHFILYRVPLLIYHSTVVLIFRYAEGESQGQKSAPRRLLINTTSGSGFWTDDLTVKGIMHTDIEAVCAPCLYPLLGYLSTVCHICRLAEIEPSTIPTFI